MSAATQPDGCHILARSCLVIAAACLAGTGNLTAQEPLTLTRLAGPIQLDGRPDEPAWQAVPVLAITQFQPRAGEPPSNATEIRLAYDDRYFYAAGSFSVERPSDILASSLVRDVDGADDELLLLLDTFDDNETAMVFATTPAGILIDAAVAGDGSERNRSWNTFWDAAATRDSAGWYAEMRIPLSSLRFQTRDRDVTMGVIITRYSARKNEAATFPALSPGYANALSRPSLARKIRLTGLSSRAPVHFTPYALGGGSQTARLNAPGSAFERVGSGTAELGGDLKIGLTSNLTLDLTGNTDFAQVEADDEQVNLTRFSLFFPEKRQFFQERAGVFTITTGAPSDPGLMFHSRRIGLTEAGEPLRIYGGGRLVGRAGSWDLGILDLHTATGSGGGTENVGVLRVRRRVLNDQSTVGAIATTRVLSSGGYNIAYALDGRIRTRPRDYVVVQLAQTRDSGAADAGLASSMARVAWERPGTNSSRGLAYQTGLKWSGQAFDPGLGFQPRRNFVHGFANIRYGWYPAGSSMFRVIQPSAAANAFRRNRDGRVESAFVGTFLNYELKSGFNGWIGFNHKLEDLTAPLVLSPTASVPAGRYRFDYVEVALQPPSGRAFRPSLLVDVGSFYDGTQVIAGVGSSWTASRHLELEVQYQATRIRFADRGERFNGDLLRVRVQGSANTHLSASAFVQFSQAGQSVIGNLRVRYHFSEGRDLYLVYNERLNTERDRLIPAVPRLPLSQERTLLVKYTYTLAR